MHGWAVLLLAAAACSRGAGDLPTTEGSGAAPECATDGECVGAAMKCCDCPAFAVPLTDASQQACAAVLCPYRHCPRNVRPMCDSGRCVLACVAMTCRGSCLFGFATDASGCLSCDCAVPVLRGCLADDDCVRVRGDCCGCERGGHDTAVLAEDAAEHDASLHCPVTPQCPVANTCAAAETPQCLRGRCVLGAAAVLPPGACGRFDLRPCPPGQICVVNGPDAVVNQQGLGLCRPEGSQPSPQPATL
jgi:hypothetical protein